MIRFLTQDKEFFPKRLAEKLQHVQQMGFDGFEIDGKLLLDDFEAVKKAIAETDFPVVTCCGGYEGWIGDFDETKRQQAIQQISLLLERMAEVGGKGIVAPAAWGMFSLRLPPMVPPRNEKEDEMILLDSLQQLNSVAAKHEVSLFLEPLNRYEDHMINTLQKAGYYIKKGSCSNVRIIADFYHMNIEEARMDESLKQYQHAIGHIHLADSHRYQPGTGHLDFEKNFRALKEMDYAGAMAFECRVIGNDANAAYARSLKYIKNIYADVWENE